MQELDIDKLLGTMNDPSFATNTESLMKMLGEFNKVLGRMQQTMSLLDNMGLKELIVRAAGAKLGVDPETPLKSDKRQGIVPQSTYHKEVLSHLNSLSEDQLGKMLSALVSDEAKEAIEEPVEELEAYDENND